MLDLLWTVLLFGWGVVVGAEWVTKRRVSWFTVAMTAVAFLSVVAVLLR